MKELLKDRNFTTIYVLINESVFIEITSWFKFIFVPFKLKTLEKIFQLRGSGRTCISAPIVKYFGKQWFKECSSSVNGNNLFSSCINKHCESLTPELIYTSGYLGMYLSCVQLNCAQTLTKKILSASDASNSLSEMQKRRYFLLPLIILAHSLT